MKLPLSRVITLTVFFALIVACSDGFPKEFEAPNFTLKSPMKGNEVILYDLKGQPVIIYWFTSW